MPSFTMNWGSLSESMARFTSLLDGSTYYAFNDLYPVTEPYPVSVKPTNTIAKEKAKMIIPLEMKEKLVEVLPIPPQVLHEVLYFKRNQPTNFSYWTKRASALWRDLLLRTPIEEWIDLIRVDFKGNRLTLEFESAFSRSSAQPIQTAWTSALLSSSFDLDALVASLKFPHGFTVKKRVEAFDDVYELTWKPEIPESRVSRIMQRLTESRSGLRLDTHDVYVYQFTAWLRRSISVLDHNFAENYAEARKWVDAQDRKVVKRKSDEDAERAFLKFHDTHKKTAFAHEELRRNNINTLSIPEHGLKSSRQWGIEVEAAGARHTDTPKGGWDRKYDSSLESAYEDYGGQYIYSEDCPENDHAEYIIDENGEEVENPDYMYEYDCIFCGDAREEQQNDDTGEFVSPILHSFHSRGLERLVGQLQNEPQNSSAGIHVHVDVDDLTPKQIGGLVFGYEMIEPLLEVSYQRETRSYCKSRYPDETLSVIRSTRTATVKAHRNYREQGAGHAIDPGDRYVSLNLCSLSAHGTVEFRAMGPVYEYEHLIKWAHFCREMVNLAKANVTQKEWSSIRSFGDLRVLFAKYGAEQEGAFRDITDNVIIREVALEEV